MSVTARFLRRLRPRVRARFGSARVLAQRTARHLRDHGLRATARKAADWMGRRLLPQPAPAQADPFTDSIAIAFDPARVVPCGGIYRDRLVVQKIALPPGQLVALEIFVATYARRNLNVTEFSLRDAAGHVLQEWRVRGTRMADNSFLTLPVADPAALGGLRSAFLHIRSPRGTRRHCITCYTSDTASGALWILEGATDEAASVGVARDRRQCSPLGSLVYRLRYRNPGRDIYYRWPDPPDAMAPPGAASRTTHGVSASAIAPGLSAATDAILAQRASAVVLAVVPWSPEVRALLELAATHRVPTVFNCAGCDPSVPDLRRTMASCDFAVATDAAARRAVQADRKRVLDAGDSIEAMGSAALAAYARLQRPRVSIVSILYNKSRELPHVLASYAAQSYEGEIEVVFVDDHTPDDSVDVVEEFLRSGGKAGKLDIRIVRNARNSGNCVSRNAGIAAARGDILVIIDADCMLNRDFIRRHVEAHAFDDCEVVIGPLNIETHGEDPDAVLARFERAPQLAASAARLQDADNRTSFVNCITRNFSIKREAVPSDGMFDPLFGYSADPASGFGWEDVEAGYRLYRDGARIKYVAEAISIHVSAPPGPEGTRPARSMRNFACLLEKHPHIASVVPAWSLQTFEGIRSWALRTQVQLGAAEAVASNLLSPATRRHARPLARRLRVLTYRWHVPHQYELWKLPIDVTVVTGIGSPMTESWELGQRPQPRNATFARFENIDPRDFDIAILHFDENVLAPENTNGVIGPDWGAAFRFLRENLKLPMVAICHGTPQFHGQYTFDYDKPDLLNPIERERQRLVDYLADVHVVCNSHQAASEWRFHRSSVIWHGFDPAEFPPATYERGILSPLGPLVMSRPHYRGYFLYRQVFDGCEEELRPETLTVPEPHPVYRGNAYAIAKFRRYVDEIRRYSVYFNPTLRSPMPRARGEPMMCGVIPVSADNHDVARFVEQGVDGFYSNDAGELRDQLRFLLRNPDATRRMGAAAREKAMRVFHIERYLDQWSELLGSLVR